MQMGVQHLIFGGLVAKACEWVASFELSYASEKLPPKGFPSPPPLAILGPTHANTATWVY